MLLSGLHTWRQLIRSRFARSAAQSRRRKTRPIPLFAIERLEDRTLLAANLIVVTDPVGPNDLSLRLNGADLEVFDNIGSTVIDSQALAVTTGVQLIGADNADDTFTIDYGFGGVFSLVDGINVNGGTGIGSDSLIVITETGDENQLVDVRGTYVTSRNLSGGSTLRVDYTGIDALAVETGDGDDLINVRFGGGLGSLPAALRIDAGAQSTGSPSSSFPNIDDRVSLLGIGNVVVDGNTISDGTTTTAWTLTNVEETFLRLIGSTSSLTVLGTAGNDAFSLTPVLDSSDNLLQQLDTGVFQFRMRTAYLLGLTVDLSGDGTDSFLVEQIDPIDTEGLRTLQVDGGGAGSDALTFITETGDVNQLVDVRGSYVTSRNLSGGSTLRVDYTGIDALAVETGDGDDQIIVRMGGLPSVVNIDGGPQTLNDTLKVFGTPGDDIIVVTTTQVTFGNPVVETINYTGIDALAVETGDGDDYINVRMGGLPSVVNIDGGPQTLNDTLEVFGTPGDDIIVVTTTQVTFGNPVVETINYGDIEELIIDGRGGNDDINEVPVIDDQSFAVYENSPNSTLVGTVVASDPDAGDVLTYAISGGTGATAFSINAATGVLTVLDSTQIDFETTPSFTLDVEITDSGGLTATGTMAITLNDLPEVTILNLPTSAIDEGTSIILNSAVNAVDPTQITYEWTVTGIIAGDFSIQSSDMISSSLELTFLNEGDFIVQLVIKDQNGATIASDSKIITVVNVAPTATLLTSDQPSLNVSGRFKATYTVEDVGILDVVTALVDYGDGAGFEPVLLSANGTQLVLGHTYSDTSTAKFIIIRLTDGTDIFDVSNVLVIGTGGSDSINVDFGSAIVTINGVSVGTFDPTGGIFIFGLGGDDEITVDGDITLQTILDGGDGDDTLQGGGGENVLIGSAGFDTVILASGENTIVGEAETVIVAGTGVGVSIDEGAPFNLVTAAFDNPTAAEINWGDGTVEPATVNQTAGTISSSHQYADNGEFLAVARMTEPSVAEIAINVTVTNVAPDSVAINEVVSTHVFAMGDPQPFTGSFSDAGIEDTHEAVWTFTHAVGGATVTETLTGTLTESAGSGTVSDSFSFVDAGIYTVTLTITDDDTGATTSAESMFVIYDPSAGFVTGGGWFISPLGAYVADPSLSGKANFGFVAKYKKGSTTLTGQTEFQFKTAKLNFHSDEYIWLVIAGARAQYQGTGTINGSGNYGFKLTAIDGQVSGGGGVDKIRLKIWDITVDGDVIVYDSGLGAGDDADPSMILGGGKIIIHSKGNALQAAGGAVSGGTAVQSLSYATLQPVVTQAIEYWTYAGADANQLNALSRIDVHLANLSGSYLGMSSASSNLIWIDVDAAGYGWGSDGMDLFSTVSHELGHQIGLDHDVMGATLGAGIPQLASSSFLTNLDADDGPGFVGNIGMSSRFGGYFSLSGDRGLSDPWSFTTRQDRIADLTLRP